jgi:hypothetical protein
MGQGSRGGGTLPLVRSHDSALSPLRVTPSRLPGLRARWGGLSDDSGVSVGTIDSNQSGRHHLNIQYCKSKLRPALKTHGGKAYLARRIVSRPPSHRAYIEAFAGGLGYLQILIKIFLRMSNERIID